MDGAPLERRAASAAGLGGEDDDGVVVDFIEVQLDAAASALSDSARELREEVADFRTWMVASAGRTEMIVQASRRNAAAFAELSRKFEGNG